jgi:hypothetical protein
MGSVKNEPKENLFKWGVLEMSENWWILIIFWYFYSYFNFHIYLFYFHNFRPFQCSLIIFSFLFADRSIKGRNWPPFSGWISAVCGDENFRRLWRWRMMIRSLFFLRVHSSFTSFSLHFHFT